MRPGCFSSGHPRACCCEPSTELAFGALDLPGSGKAARRVHAVLWAGTSGLRAAGAPQRRFDACSLPPHHPQAIKQGEQAARLGLGDPKTFAKQRATAEANVKVGAAAGGA